MCSIFCFPAWNSAAAIKPEQDISTDASSTKLLLCGVGEIVLSVMIPSEYPFNSFSLSKRPTLLEGKALHCAASISLSIIPVIL